MFKHITQSKSDPKQPPGRSLHLFRKFASRTSARVKPASLRRSLLDAAAYTKHYLCLHRFIILVKNCDQKSKMPLSFLFLPRLFILFGERISTNE